MITKETLEGLEEVAIEQLTADYDCYFGHSDAIAILELIDLVKKYEERLQISPYGDDKIDQLEETIDNLRFRIEALEEARGVSRSND